MGFSLGISDEALLRSTGVSQSVRLIHEPTGDASGGGQRRDDSRTLASEVEVADAFFARLRGLTFRRSIPDEYALVFRFERCSLRSLHMLFVPFPIDAVWLVDGEVQRVERLRPWTGFSWARADVVLELPAGAADGVDPGDRVRLDRSG